MARLYHYLNGELLGTVELTEYDVIVGRRQDCDLILNSRSASRQHLRFSPRREGGWLMSDLGSENGTYVDGIREYRKILGDRAVIQVGEEMLIYEPFEDQTDPGKDQGPKFRPLPKPVSQPRFKEQDPGEITQHVVPALHRRAVADARSRLRPHLVVETGDGDRLFALDSTVTRIGYGKLKVSLGPARRGKQVVLAEVTRHRDGSWSVAVKGVFKRIRCGGKSVASASLRPGTKFELDGHTIRFELGISEVEWGS